MPDDNKTPDRSQPASRLMDWVRNLVAEFDPVSVAAGSFSVESGQTNPVTGEKVATLAFRIGLDGIAQDDSLPAIYASDRLQLLAKRDPEPDSLAGVAEGLRACLAAAAPGSLHPDALLHALLPFPCVSVMFPPPVMALTGHEDVEETFGDSVAWIPWRESRPRTYQEAAARCEEKGRNLKGLLLAHRGMVVWGETPEECRRNALDLVKQAANRTKSQDNNSQDNVSDKRRVRVADFAPLLRGLCGGESHLVGSIDVSDRAVDLVEHARTAGLSLAPRSFAELLLTGPEPVILNVAPDADGEAIREQAAKAFQESDDPQAPRAFLVPGCGLLAFAPVATAAHLACEAVRESLRSCAEGKVGEVMPDSASERELAAAVRQQQDADLRPLAGRIALVTGGTSGIGLATARRLLAEGACVAVAARDPERLDKCGSELTEEFGVDRVETVTCDVSKADSVHAAFEKVCCRWGGLDILVNNAGLSLGRSMEDTTPEDYDKQNDVMPRGSFLCSREASLIFRKQGLGGDIVYVVSKNALFAGPKNVAYGTAKAAQLHQARLVAAELAEDQVRVNVVNPDGVVQGSGIFAGGWGAERAAAYGIKEEELGKHYAKRSLLQREILPEDIAAAVFVLVGDELRKSTGLVINVDGGFAPSMLR